MDDEFVSYFCFGLAAVPLLQWLASYGDGAAYDKWMTMFNEAKSGEDDFAAVQNVRLLMAAALIGTGIFGLTVGFE